MGQYPKSALTTSILMTLLVNIYINPRAKMDLGTKMNPRTKMNPSAKLILFVSLTTQLGIGPIITLVKAANLQKIHERLLRCYAIEEH